MADAVSKEMLKSALVELAKSDREFFYFLAIRNLGIICSDTRGGVVCKKPKNYLR